MKKLITLLLLMIPSSALLSQAPVDTTVTLQNIEVQGIRFGGISSGEVKRLQVENNISSMPVSAAEAMRHIPSLTTDIEGGITFRGSTQAKTLLRGVPYGLLEEQSGDLLIQLPAFFFNQIEATAYPLIERMADGDAGMIDFSVSDPSDMPPVQVHLGAGWHERYNAGAAVHLQKNKFHFTGRYNYRQEFRERSFQKTTTNKTGTTAMNNNASARPEVHIADLEATYNPTEQDRISIYGLYHRMDYSRYGAINNTRTNPAGEVLNKMLRHRYNTQLQDAYAAEARWLHRFTNPNDRLEVVFNYNNFVYDEYNYFKNENPATNTTVAQDNLFIRQEKKNYYAAANYRKQLAGHLLLKAGYIGRFTREDYDTKANIMTDAGWAENRQKNNDFSFQRNIHTAYASIAKTWQQIEGEVGLQMEYATRKAADHSPDRFRLFPRLRLSYRTSDTDALSFSYLQRINRPLGKELNPFVDISDATHIIQGNPDLKDELVHVAEVNYTWSRPRFRLSPAFYFRYKTDRIMEVMQTNESQDIWRKENMGDSRIFGAELTASWSPSRLLSVGLAGNIFRDEIDGRTLGYDTRKSMTCWDTKATINLHITPTTELQIDGFYISDQLTAQGEIESRYTVNAGVSQYLMQRRLRLNLSLNNLFDSLEEVTTINTSALQMKQVRNRDARVAWLMISYSL
ncbi:iron complex outermembrane receptor protein [Parabacteroides sp. PFB2-10]|uniref:outer membrane beta-barrel family protein n=1 Tax=Parabacteroides sp. PFB2-10 TaxID=1742405 RepID=UPI002473E7D2|nr:outer membrane beta-barrel family protein [Parabacteroides sp. PFB2-10]MDH6312899.1 iron complex outermembrane receptor protein [Parabacteroides sp. PFB2-10]